MRAGTTFTTELVSASSPPSAPDPNSGNGLSVSSLTAAGDVSLIEGIVSFKEAELSFKASAKLIGALRRTEGEILDILV